MCQAVGLSSWARAWGTRGGRGHAGWRSGRVTPVGLPLGTAHRVGLCSPPRRHIARPAIPFREGAVVKAEQPAEGRLQAREAGGGREDSGFFPFLEKAAARALPSPDLAELPAGGLSRASGEEPATHPRWRGGGFCSAGPRPFPVAEGAWGQGEESCYCTPLPRGGGKRPTPAAVYFCALQVPSPRLLSWTWCSGSRGPQLVLDQPFGGSSRVSPAVSCARSLVLSCRSHLQPRSSLCPPGLDALPATGPAE